MGVNTYRTELVIDDNKKFPIAEYRSTLYNDIKKKRKERRRRAKLAKKGNLSHGSLAPHSDD